MSLLLLFSQSITSTQQTVTKTAKYTVKTTPTAPTKTLRYVAKTPNTLNKTLIYKVRTSPSATKSLKYTVRKTASALTKSLKYTNRTTPAKIRKAVHIGSQSLDVFINTQAEINAVITALTTAIPNVTHIAIGTYFDYGAGSANDQFTKWATAIHNAGKKMWIRSAGFNDWDGRNGATQYTASDFAAHHTTNIVTWIGNNYAIFQSGDIFETTPDESENNSCWNSVYGGLGVAAGANAYNAFITDTIAAANTKLALMGVTGVDTGWTGTNPSATRDIISPYTATKLTATLTDDYPETGLTLASDMATAMQSEINTWIAPAHQGKPKHVTFGPSVYTQMTQADQADALSQEFTIIVNTLTGMLDGVTLWQFGATDNAAKSRLFDYTGGVWVARTAAATANTLFATVSGGGVVKGLRYEVRKQASATKSLRYAIKAGLSTTKTLKYTIKTTPTALTKATRYTIKQTGAATKSLQYRIKTTATAITKSTRYTILKPQPLTKALKYTIRTTPGAATKALRYTIKRPLPVTKSLKYTVTRSAVAITKGARYTLRTTATAITKQSKYTVKTTPSAKTKALQYTIRKSQPITKPLRYLLRTNTSINKGLQYRVKSGAAITKQMRYSVIKSYSKTKALRYVVKLTAGITKPVRYAIVSAQLQQLALAYKIRTDKPTHNFPLPLSQTPTTLLLNNTDNQLAPTQDNSSVQLDNQPRDVLELNQKSNSIMLQ